jgi:predicted Zn-dependent peptidase
LTLPAPHSVTQLSNGLTILVEPVADLQSTAFALMVPSGSAYDPAGGSGMASLMCDWITRGAGDRDSREISCALDRLGVDHNATVNNSHLSLTGASLPEHLGPALEVMADIVQRPHLSDDEYEGSYAGVEHELLGLEDDPRQNVMLELVRRHYPAPWNQPPEGTLSDLERLTPEAGRQFFQQHVRPERAILGIAGRVTLAEILPTIERAFSTWEPGHSQQPGYGSRGELRAHLEVESTQTQIGVAFGSVPYRHPDYYTSWAAMTILSGGMSSRLFTEVREKRGLCYSVYATLSTLVDHGACLCYAGTTNERAQETLDVLLAELVRLSEGIAPEELQRAKAQAKSALVMAMESSSSRASSLARDWYYLGRATTVDDVQQAIDALTVDQVLEYVRRHPLHPCTIVTIGPEPLQLPD